MWTVERIFNDNRFWWFVYRDGQYVAAVAHNRHVTEAAQAVKIVQVFTEETA